MFSEFCKEYSYVPQISVDPDIMEVVRPETNRIRSSVTSGRIHGITVYNEDESVLKDK